MKRRNPFALLCAFIMLLAFSVFAHAGGTNTLPVRFDFKDDGAHAFMPKLEILSPEPIKASIGIRIQEPEPGPSPWSIALYYSVCSRDPAVVALNRVTTIEDFLNKKGLNLDISAFAGAGASGQALAGFAASMKFKAGKGLYINPGIGFDGNLSDTKKIGIGGFISITYNFGG